jgi:hypothetical protein
MLKMNGDNFGIRHYDVAFIVGDTSPERQK